MSPNDGKARPGLRSLPTTDSPLLKLTLLSQPPHAVATSRGTVGTGEGVRGLGRIWGSVAGCRILRKSRVGAASVLGSILPAYLPVLEGAETMPPVPGATPSCHHCCPRYVGDSQR